MLKNIHPSLNADVLYALRAMGHGDRLALVDANFPADTIARQTIFGRLLHMDNMTAGDAAAAILSVLPLDTTMQAPAWRMEVLGNPKEIPPVQQEVQQAVDTAEEKPCPMQGIERMTFHDEARAAYCIIVTGERRQYGCFILTKGQIPPQ